MYQSVTDLHQSITNLHQSIFDLYQSLTHINQALTHINQSLTHITQSLTRILLSPSSSSCSWVRWPMFSMRPILLLTRYSCFSLVSASRPSSFCSRLKDRSSCLTKEQWLGCFRVNHTLRFRGLHLACKPGCWNPRWSPQCSEDHNIFWTKPKHT